MNEIDKLEQLAKAPPPPSTAELALIAELRNLIGELRELRKLRAVADAAENHRAWMDAGTTPGRSFFPEQLKAALAALNAKDTPS